MIEPTTLARPYARAAFKFAVENGAVDSWHQALATVAAIVAEPSMAEVLDDPATTASQRTSIVITVIGDNIPAGVAQFVSVMAENHRLGLLGEVATLFADLRSALDAAANVTVTSAFDVADAAIEQLSASLTAKLGKTVDMTIETDASLIGGAIIRAGDMVIDGSVRGRLHKLATALKS
ncbi:MAG: F0F1 ATP synthase subunit delta [Pseudomonadota bacterium]|nr:F0F1 ATP synthase subunit delta [Pseudomonadota bacterium]